MFTSTIKAPAGGATSIVNGQFYAGGEYMPEHGLFCGKKGAARKKKVDRWAARGRSMDLGGTKLFEVFERDVSASHISYVIGVAIAASETAALAAFRDIGFRATHATEC